jgi:redox-sensitive bicupin YhaK (pirin superfamily)
MTSSTAVRRHIARTITTPPPAPGFAGPGHTAVFVVDPNDFATQDPFILLADDRLDLPEGAPVGSEHPHAGFEIATFVVEGSLRDRDEGVLRAGDVQWTTAGRGIIHGEHVVPQGRTRILQLWFTLPEAERWTEPRFETITRDAAPVRREPGVEARVYSGGSGNGHARTGNHARVTLVDAKLDSGATLEQELPASHNGFVYVLEGAVRIVDDGGTTLRAGQVGWLDRAAENGPSMLRLTGGDSGGARLVLYAGQPQNAPIVMHGPFVGGSRADIMRVSRDYMEGRFERMSALVRTARAATPE